VLPAGGVEVEVAEGLVRIAVVPAEQIVVQEALRMKSQEMARELGGTDWNETFDQKLAEHKRLAANGLLPIPKAGAAAPQASNQPEPAAP
jgi:hypothetical protein